MAGQSIQYQRCGSCASVWYFRRAFCPRCGADAPATEQASGRGVIEAVTTVTRAPSRELSAFAPYGMALVAMPEGFRVMAHAEAGVALGDAVEVEFVPFGERTVPRFKRTTT